MLWRVQFGGSKGGPAQEACDPRAGAACSQGWGWFGPRLEKPLREERTAHWNHEGSNKREGSDAAVIISAVVSPVTSVFTELLHTRWWCSMFRCRRWFRRRHVSCFGHGGMQARHEQEILYGLVQRYVASVQLFSLCSEASLQFQSGLISCAILGMGRAPH